jgi:BMFP domain-containing protein YqiC
MYRETSFLEQDLMTQTTNRVLDDLARLMTDAAGVARGMRNEAETLMRTQAERILADLDVVHRDEFEAVKLMAETARRENESLAARIAILEEAAAKPKAATKASPKASTKTAKSRSSAKKAAD